MKKNLVEHSYKCTYIQSCFFVRFISFIIKSLIQYYIIYCFYTVSAGLLFKKIFWCVQMMIFEITRCVCLHNVIITVSLN